MASVRAELLPYFTHILLGDALAAEYLILHLVSNVYAKFNLQVLPGFVPNPENMFLSHFSLRSFCLVGTLGGMFSLWASSP